MSKRHLTGAALAIAVAAAAATVAGGTGASAAPGGNAALKAAEQSAAASTGKALGLPADQSLVVRSVLTDPDGTRHVRYDRTVDGLPVVGGDLVVAKSANGTVKDSHWNSGKAVAPASTTVTVGRAAATATAAKTAGYQVDSSSADLVVYASQGAPRLAWQVTTTGIRASQTPSRLKTWVDARTGRVLDSAETIEEGTGNTQYSGTVTLNTTGTTGAWKLRDSLGNHTTDLNGATSGTGTEFTDADNVWGTGATSSRQTAAADAQWGAQADVRLLPDHPRPGRHLEHRCGRPQPRPLRQRLRQRVLGRHPDDLRRRREQRPAADRHRRRRPRDEPRRHRELRGPELPRRVRRPQRGDVRHLRHGRRVVRQHRRRRAGDYLIGEKININGNGTPLRYMDKPSKDGRSADCWSKSVGRLNVHYSSGPLNHWFYLVSEGSGAKTVNGVTYNSPTCNGGSVTGVGHSVAERVWYRTLTTKLTSSSGYAAARNGAIASAKDLYGRNSAECAAVLNGFNAIAVPAGTQTCSN